MSLLLPHIYVLERLNGLEYRYMIYYVMLIHLPTLFCVNLLCLTYKYSFKYMLKRLIFKCINAILLISFCWQNEWCKTSIIVNIFSLQRRLDRRNRIKGSCCLCMWRIIFCICTLFTPFRISSCLGQWVLLFAVHGHFLCLLTTFLFFFI